MEAGDEPLAYWRGAHGQKSGVMKLASPAVKNMLSTENAVGTSDDQWLAENVRRYAPAANCALDARGNFRRVGAACQQVLGHESGELLGRSFADVLHPADRAAALENCLRAYRQAAPVGFESRCLGQAGQEIVIAWAVVWVPADELLLCAGRDVTAQRQAARQAHEREEMHRALIEHGFDMVALLDEQGVYTYAGGSTLKVLGYPPEQLLGRNAFDLIHPDDVERARHYWGQLGTRPTITVPDFRYRTAGGEWKWIETTVSNQTQNPAIGAYAVSSRDITERKHKEAELAKSEQRFRLMFENNLSLAVLQTNEGEILDANPAFLSFFKQPKDAVLNRQLGDFLPVAVSSFSGDPAQDVANGYNVWVRTALQTKEGEHKTLNIIKVPLVVGGKMLGTHVVVKDITEIDAAQRLIQRQAQRLNTILESITDAFLSLDRSWNLTYLNREAERLLGVSRETCFGQNIWTVFPNGVNSCYQQKGRQALETGETVHFEAFLTRQSRWLDVKVFPSPEGLAVYFSDVTARVEAGKQLKLLALVAQGTDNGVIITDAQGRTEWVNEGFYKHTGYALADVVGQKLGAVLQGPDTDPEAVECIRQRLAQGGAFSATLLNYHKSGQTLWISMDITPIYNDAGELTQYVAIQQDITFRKEAEARQAQMSQDLYRHNRDLEQFAYIISHNLRAPLANALGLATLLTKVDKTSEAFDVSLAHLRQSMVRTDTVLGDLNAVLAIRSTQDALAQEPVALAEVGQQAVLHLEEPLRRCGGRVALDVADGLAVSGNRAYLYSIFYNLLSNAIKYRSDERPLVVEVRGFRGPHGGPSISFSDNGSGFDLAKAGANVFQLYKRFHANRPGRGMGLFLVKAHVEALGGKIEVTSGVNLGTRFLIQLDKR